MIQYKRESNEVLYDKSELTILNNKDLNLLSKKAKLNKKKIIRLCVHKSTKDKVHQMFIVHPRNYFVRPHGHNKNEAMFVLSGLVDIIIFDINGKIKKIIKMGNLQSGKVFYYKLPKKTFHTLIIKSENLVFYEITEGPFRKKNMIFPEWFKKKSKKNILEFKKNLKIKINNHRRSNEI